MSQWYSQHYIKSEPQFNNWTNDLIAKLSNKTEDKNIEFKVNQIEKEYSEKLKLMEALCANPNEVKSITTENSLVILQKELDIIKLLTKYSLQTKNLDYKFFMTCLEILRTLSETLRNRIGQKEIIHDTKSAGEDCILRCSYKFCSYKDNCIYNYNLKNKNLCYQDHYVHNMVSADLKVLIDYIQRKFSQNEKVMHNKEILKTINTLGFVISHMESELKTKCFYLPKDEWESCHIVKNK